MGGIHKKFDVPINRSLDRAEIRFQKNALFPGQPLSCNELNFGRILSIAKGNNQN